MKRPIVGILIAVILAIAGTLALVAYVRSAKDEAVSGEQPVQVYVVQDEVAKGTTAAELEKFVELTDVPQRLVADDAVVDLTTLDPTFVAAIDLSPGEQVLSGRFVDPRTLVRVAAPEGLQEITLALSPERAVGGVLAPGDTVGVLVSFDPFQVTTAAVPGVPPTPVDPNATSTTVAAASTPNMTHFTLHKVLVTAIQFSEKDTTRVAERQSDADGNTDTTLDPTVAEAPSQQLLVTMAVSAAEAEQLVFAAEFGFIYLTAEGPDAVEDGTRILTLDGVYVTVPR